MEVMKEDLYTERGIWVFSLIMLFKISCLQKGAIGYFLSNRNTQNQGEEMRNIKLSNIIAYYVNF